LVLGTPRILPLTGDGFARVIQRTEDEGAGGLKGSEELPLPNESGDLQPISVSEEVKKLEHGVSLPFFIFLQQPIE